MTLFLSTYINKLDKKGRVSVPANFRSALAGQSFHGVILFASYKHQCIEACAMDRMQQLSESIDDMALFSDDQDDLTASLFADAHQISLDADGRIILPTDLAAHADLGDRAAFVGRGKTFQIWNPEILEQHKATARQRLKETQATVRLKTTTPE